MTNHTDIMSTAFRDHKVSETSSKVPDAAPLFSSAVPGALINDIVLVRTPSQTYNRWYEGLLHLHHKCMHRYIFRGQLPWKYMKGSKTAESAEAPFWARCRCSSPVDSWQLHSAPNESHLCLFTARLYVFYWHPTCWIQTSAKRSGHWCVTFGNEAA